MAVSPTPVVMGPLGVHTCLPSKQGPLINGVRVDPRTSEQIEAFAESTLLCGKGHVVNFLAVDPTVIARRDSVYRDVLNSADLNLPDGMPLVWMSRFLGFPATRVTGTDGIHRLAAWGVSRSLGHFLLGGTDPSVTRCAAHLARTHPNISLAGTEAPPFREMNDAEIRLLARRVRASGASFLWVGIGTPRQHRLGNRLRDLDAAPFIGCVGAAFDFVSGEKRRAPAWMRDSGFEWLHRLGSEPRRLWRRYLLGNPRFIAGVTSDLISGQPRAVSGRPLASV